MQQNLITLQEAVNQIKALIEQAISDGGTEAKNNLIRSQQPIKLLHEVVKSELIRNGVDPNYIKPSLGLSAGEMKLAGFFKQKDQDVCVLPITTHPCAETLKFEGILYGKRDPYGQACTEKTLSINVRSQLSSSAKNFDTLYERTYAEALNLHLRCPQMVLGEFYMIAVKEYDSDAANNNQVQYKNVRGIANHIQKYLLSFQAINGRNNTDADHYKYEKVCLLIVDFSQPIPKIYNTDAELKADGLLPAGSTASIEKLNFQNFIPDMLKIYKERFK
ncbi:hypothetical protein KML24007_04090 [Alistipes indistinctus]|uniref:hypothetical protein n=1 Tax=Alistipes indistinctus TaxID=626932 RepID=UPI0036F32075